MQSATLKQLFWLATALLLFTLTLIIAAPSHAQTTTGTISGTVTNEDGTVPLADIQVVVYDNMYRTIGTGCTAADGSYTISNVPFYNPLYARISIYQCDGSTPSPYVPELYNNVALGSAPALIQLTGSQPSRTDIDFALRVGATISGTVYNEVGNTPLANIQVTAYGANGNWDSYTCTAADGTYTLVGVPYGSDIQVSAFALACNESGSYFAESASTLNFDPITNPSASNINFVLQQAGEVNGYVYDENNQPLANIPVRYQEVSGNYHWATYCTDSNGYYRIWELPRTKTLYVSAGGDTDSCGGMRQTQEWWSAASSFETAQAVTITPTALTQDSINFTLEPSSILPPEFSRSLSPAIVGVGQTSTLNVTVTNVNDTPLVGWFYENLPIGLTQSYNMTSNCGGGTSPGGTSYGLGINLAPQQSCTYSVDLYSYKPRTYYLPENGAASFTHNELGNLPPTGFNEVALGVAGELGSISGSLTDSLTGDPLPNMWIYANSSNYQFSTNTCTDASGNYQLAEIPHGVPIAVYSGYYTCDNQSTNYPSEWWQDAAYSYLATLLTLDATTPTVTSIHLTPAKAGIITGFITDEDTDSPAANVSVHLYNDTMQLASVCSEWNGKYTFNTLPLDETYYVKAGGGCFGAPSLYHDRWWQSAETMAAAQPIPVTYAAPTAENISISLEPMILLPPEITRSLSEETVSLGEISTLTVTVTNVNDFALNYLNLSETLPAGIKIPGGITLTSTCGSQPYISGGNSYLLPIWELTPLQSCTYTIPLVSYTPGTYPLESSGYGVTAGGISLPPTVFNTVTLTAEGALGSVSGTVTDANTNAPLNNMRVVADGGYGFQVVACTDANGNYQLNNLPHELGLAVWSGGYNCNSQPTSYLPQNWQSGITLNATSPSLTDIDFALLEGGSISGTVYRDDEVTPLPGMNVWATSPDGLGGHTAITDSNGQYSFIGLQYDTDWIIRSGMNQQNTGFFYYPEYWDHTLLEANASAIQVTQAAPHRTGIDFALSEPGMLTGSVTSDGNSLNFAKVEVLLDGQIINTGCTNVSGGYWIGNLPRQTALTVRTASTNCMNTPQMVEYWQEAATAQNATSVTITETGLGNINFTLDSQTVSGTISGVVYAADNVTPISNITVTAALPAMVSNIALTTTNSAGAYTLTGLPLNTDLIVQAEGNGTYQTQYWAYAPSQASASAIQLTQAAPARTDIDFALSADNSILPPVITRSLSPEIVAVGQVSHLTVVVSNVGTTPLTNLYLYEAMTAVLEMASPPVGSPTTTCTGYVAPNGNGYYVSIYTLAPQQSCTYTIPLVSDVPGVYPLTIDGFTSVSSTLGSLPPTVFNPVTLTVQGDIGIISGIVYAADNVTPLSNITVTATIPATAFDFVMTTTDVSGAYTLGGLPLNTDLLIKAQDGKGSYYPQYWAYAPSTAAATTIQLTGAAPTLGNINFALNPAGVATHGTFTGTVYAADNVTPLSNIAVTAILPASASTIAMTTTNSAGQYTLIALPMNTDLIVKADGSASGYQMQYWANAPSAATATTIQATSALWYRTDINFALNPSSNPTGTISGIVYAADNVTPLAEVPVSVSIPALASNIALTTTNNSGQYTLTGLPLNTDLVVQAGGSPSIYLSQYWAYASSVATASAVQLTEGIPARTGINFALSTSGTVSGVVTADGSPVYRAKVELLQDGIVLATGCTNSDGSYSITFSATSTFLQIRTAGTNCDNAPQRVEYWIEARSPASAATLTPPYGLFPGTNFTLDDEPELPVFTRSFSPDNLSFGQVTVMTVTMTNPNDFPLTGVHLNENLPGGLNPVMDTSNTNSCGSRPYSMMFTAYYVNNATIPANGTCTFTVHLMSYIQNVYTLGNGITNFTSNETGQLQLNLPTATVTFGGQAGTISGTVTDINGNPVQTQMQARVIGSLYTVNLNSDSNGQYTLTDIPVGVPVTVGVPFASPYLNEWWQNAYTEASATPITLDTASLTGIDFVLAPSGTINGRLYDASAGNAPISNAQVDMLLNGEVLASTCSDATGYFTANGIPVGETIYARAAASQVACGGSDRLYIEEWWQEAATQAAATPIVLSISPTYIEFTLLPIPTPGAIYGTIQGVSAAGSVPLLNAKVEFYNTDMGFTGAVCTDDSGAFNQPSLPFDIAYFIKVTQYCDGTSLLPYLETWWDGSLYGTQNSTNAVSITPTAASPTHQVNLLLPMMTSITGQITHAGTGAPLGGVPLEAVFIDNHVISRACSSASGDYVLSAILLNQNVYVRVATTGACAITPSTEQWWQDAATLAEATPIVLTSAERYRAFIDFTVDVTVEPPTAPTISAPVGLINATTPDYIWTKVANAATYRLYIQDAYGQVLYDQAGVGSCDATTCTHSPIVLLADGMSYRAWVQAINIAGAAWSEPTDYTSIWSSTPPAAPVMTAPAGVSSDTTPVYAWQPASGATSYRLFISDAYGITLLDTTYTDLGTLCPTESCTVTPDLPLPDGTYSVWVQALNTAGSAWSSAQVFSVQAVSAPPSAPIVTAPTGFTSDTTPAYTWDEINGATSYRVYVQAVGGAVVHDQTYGADVCTSGVCTVEPIVVLTLEQAYQVWVQSLNAQGSTWSDAANFYVGTTLPAAAVITAPAGYLSDTTPTYTWNLVDTATSYRLYIQAWDATLMLDQVYGTEICSGGVCAVDPGIGLSIGMTYDVWVLTSNAGGNGPWSNPSTFAITNGAPLAPTLITPTGNTISTQPAYQWNEATGATLYRLYVQDAYGTVITNEVITNNVCTGGVCSYTPAPTLTNGTTYTWWVLAANDGGGAWSNGASFSVGSAPSGVTISAPASPTTNTQPTYEWTEASGATGYRLYVNTVGGTVVIDQVFPSSNCTAGVCAVTPAVTLASSEAYQVWVLASNSSGNGPWSGPYNFSVIP